jgi:surface protein
MGASINLNKIKKIYCNRIEISTVYSNYDIVYQNGKVNAVDRNYNYFTFNTSGSTTITLANYRAGDTTEWNGLTYWGDGTTDYELSHTYEKHGTYNVKTKWMIHGKNDEGIDYGDSNTRQSLVACKNINKNITDAAYLFSYCDSLKSVDMSRFKTNNITDMSYMFCGCTALENLNMRGLDTSNVTNMKYMFGDCGKLKDLQISHFNVSNVTDMSYMFIGCGGIDGSHFKNWDVSNVVDMRAMFNGAEIVKNCLDLSGWNVSNVDDFISMFTSCYASEGIDISYWNIKDDATTNTMFYWVYCKGCERFDFSVHGIEDHIKHIGVSDDDWKRM